MHEERVVQAFDSICCGIRTNVCKLLQADVLAHAEQTLGDCCHEAEKLAHCTSRSPHGGRTLYPCSLKRWGVLMRLFPPRMRSLKRAGLGRNNH